MSDKQKPAFGPCTSLIMSRRKFLGGSALALASVPLMSACEFAETYNNTNEPVESEAEFALTDEGLAGLGEVGGTALLVAGPVEILLVRDAEDSVLGFDRRCPHAQLDMAPVDGNALPAVWDGEARTLKCQWHASIFADDGDFVEGPPGVADLKRYEVTFDAANGTGVVQILPTA